MGQTNKRITLLPGDGIGPEVTREVRRLLERVGEVFDSQFEISEALLGGCAIDAEGTPLPTATADLCQRSDAVFLGAVGGPKWDKGAGEMRPETGLLRLRKAMAVYANLRPVSVFPCLVAASPLKPEYLEGVDLLIIRELTGGLYFGQPRGRIEDENGLSVVDTLRYSEQEMERIIRLGFETARKRRKKLTSVDKANVLDSSRLWREIAIRIGADYPDIELSHMLVDNAAMQLVKNPAQFDVIVTENMFGDILSDEAAMISGSIGMLPSASLGESGPGLYEPIHGSAPDIAGMNKANPLASFLSVAMMLRYSLDMPEAANAVESAVAGALDAGLRTGDLAARGEKALSTTEMSAEVCNRIARR